MVRLLRPDQEELYNLWAMLGLVLIAAPIVVDVATNLRSRGFQGTQFFMDQVVLLAILACLASGKYVTGATVALVLVIGQVLEERSTLGARSAIDRLARLSRAKARRRNADGTEEEVPAEELAAGDVVVLRPGDTVPADGTVESGESSLDQAAITGESMPVDVAAGAEVFAGTTNLTGSLTVKVARRGDETVIGRVRQIVQEAENSQAPIMRLTDRYARFYAPFIILIAAVVLAVTGDLDRAIATIIVSIPCAFILASPSAMIAALATASRLGILVRSSTIFEQGHLIDTVVFDKTGTLTHGRLRLESIEPFAAEGKKAENELLQAAAAVEQHSTHPIGKAIVREAKARELIIPESTGIEEHHGRGMAGQVRGDGRVLVGRRKYLRAEGIELPEEIEAEKAEDRATTPVYVAANGRYLGQLNFADEVRANAAEVIGELRAKPSRIEQIVVLTGDRQAVAQNVAQSVRADEVHAQLLPEEKHAVVDKLRAEGRNVLVIGDGVNDAPALAHADIGVAMGALGSDIAIQSADVALMEDNLARLNSFLRLSRRVWQVIHQNIWFGFGFILVLMALSALGYISPLGAAFLHEVSAFFVIFNSARLLRFKG